MRKSHMDYSVAPPLAALGEIQMAHFSVEIMRLTGSVLSGNQYAEHSTTVY